MQRLVESWVRAEKERYGNTLAAAIRRMNEQLNTKVTHSRVAEWRRGVYTPSQQAISTMLYRTLPWALEQSGATMSAAQWRTLEELLWDVTHEDGKRWLYLT